MSIFKACDIRGVYPTEINEAKVYKIGRAISTILDGKTVVIGGDVRLSTPAIKRAMIDGLVASGCNVYDVGILPTPAFYFAKKKLGATGGVMVTASHNPSEYNGLKIVLGDLPITVKELAQIKAISRTNGFLSRIGRQQSKDIIGDYEADLIAKGTDLLQGVKRMPKVVIDCGNGCYSEIAPRIMEQLGVPIVPLFCKIDGSFSSREPNSAIASNLTSLCRMVVEKDADMGIAFDGDGDRVAFVDQSGRVLTADQVIAIIAEHLHGGIAAGDKVVLDIKCSMAVHDVVSLRGAAPLMEKSGHTYIKTRMIQENAVLGGEISGHLFYRELDGGDDGLYSAIAMTGIVGAYGSLAKLAAEAPSYATTPDLRIRMQHDPELLDRIASFFPEDRVSRLDGVRVAFDEGWGLARLSVTEPIITLRFEGKDEAALKRIMDKFLEAAPLLKIAISKSLEECNRG